MQTKPFGWTGVDVALIGQGTWHMGDSRHRAAEVAALRTGLDLGMTHIDTAELYSGGAAEEMIAEALQGRPRSELFITSKVSPQNGSYQGTIAAAERTLSRLRTEYLDLYLLHWPGRQPIGETMRAMEDLVSAGKIRFLGVSNFDAAGLRDAMRALTRQRIASNQVLYNLADRSIEHDLIPFCEREGVAVVGYTPFGNWPGRRHDGLRVLAEIGARHDRTPRQVALRFLTRLPSLFAIPKASDAEHVRENAAAGTFDLSPQEIAAIDRAFPA